MGRAVRTAGQMRPAEPPSPARATAVAGGPVVEEPLGIPTGKAPPRAATFLRQVGFGLTVGDELDPALAPREPDGQRLADVLNRLARNPATGARFRVTLGGHPAENLPALVTLLRDRGHRIEIHDARYFANFGDLK
jgi:hypothetical protein